MQKARMNYHYHMHYITFFITLHRKQTTEVKTKQNVPKPNDNTYVSFIYCWDHFYSAIRMANTKMKNIQLSLENMFKSRGGQTTARKPHAARQWILCGPRGHLEMCIRPIEIEMIWNHSMETWHFILTSTKGSVQDRIKGSHLQLPPKMSWQVNKVNRSYCFISQNCNNEFRFQKWLKLFFFPHLKILTIFAFSMHGPPNVVLGFKRTSKEIACPSPFQRVRLN